MEYKVQAYVNPLAGVVAGRFKMARSRVYEAQYAGQNTSYIGNNIGNKSIYEIPDDATLWLKKTHIHATNVNNTLDIFAACLHPLP